MSDMEIADQGGSGNETGKPSGKQAGRRDAPPVRKGAPLNPPTNAFGGASGETRQTDDAERLPPGQNVLTDTAGHLAALGGVSATDRLLGLDRRPTMLGALAPPPGNSEFLRHVSPQMRRAIMRKMLDKQRERMRRLARFLRDRRDESDTERTPDERESFLEVIAEKLPPQEYNADKNQIDRAAGELDKTARMLDILDEILAMQDYTISRIGTFTQG